MSKNNNLIVKPLKNGVITLLINRPKEKNAISNQVLKEISETLKESLSEDEIRCVVISGSQQFFAAGADIKELSKLNTIDVLNNVRYEYWDIIKHYPKPIIAAVNGFALGGGCELAMHADIIIAGRNAQFGQPEINLGIIPGAGGTQRLIRYVGKSLAMKMLLSGEFIDAETAFQFGLIAEIVEPELTLDKAEKLAEKIAKKSPLAVQQAKKLMLLSFESSLETGLITEHEIFTLLTASEDRNEGINAFLEKREPKFTGK